MKLNGNILNTIFGILLVGFMVYGFFKSEIEYNKLDQKCNSYTSGKVFQVENHLSKSFVTYEYFINDDTIYKTDKIYGDKVRANIKIGKKYLVKYCVDDIELAEMLFDKPVTNY